MQAFEALYPGFRAKSAREHGDAWVIEGFSIKSADVNAARPFRVRVPIRVDEAGVVANTVDGAQWSGAQQLAALLKEKRSSAGVLWSIADELTGYMDAPGSTVVGVRVGRTGKVAVKIDTRIGPRPTLLYAWNKDTDWSATVRYSAAQWKHQAQLLRAAVIRMGSPIPQSAVEPQGSSQWHARARILAVALQDGLLADGSSLPEPFGSPRPTDAHFTARIVRVDPENRSVTIDRIQLFIGDPAYAAAIQDDPRNVSLGSPVYIRNVVRERTVLPVREDAVATRFYPGVWSPSTGRRGMAVITAFDAGEFFREYASDREFRSMLRGTGAEIVVVDGRIDAVVGNYTP